MANRRVKEIGKQKQKLVSQKNEGAQGEAAAAATTISLLLGVRREMENFQSTSFKSSRKYSFHFMEK